MLNTLNSSESQGKAEYDCKGLAPSFTSTEISKWVPISFSRVLVQKKFSILLCALFIYTLQTFYHLHFTFWNSFWEKTVFMGLTYKKYCTITFPPRSSKLFFSHNFDSPRNELSDTWTAWWSHLIPLSIIWFWILPLFLKDSNYSISQRLHKKLPCDTWVVWILFFHNSIKAIKSFS